jgi:hypothetical protein
LLYIHPPAPFLQLLPPPIVLTPRQDLFCPTVLIL